MLRTGGDLHFCIQCRIVNGRGHLTDAASGLFLGFCPHIDRCRAVALGGGALSYDIIKGEYLSGVDHRSVDGLTGQRQIIGSIGIRHMGRAVCGELVPEQNGLDLFSSMLGGDRSHGNTEFLPVAGGQNIADGLFPVQGIAVFALQHLAAVIIRLHRVSGKLPVGICNVYFGGLHRVQLQRNVSVGLLLHRILGQGV